MPSSKAIVKSQRASGELFLVSTPIGHLKDITLRALEVLQTVDRIACEDTRTSGVLLKHYGISTPLCAYHAHNEAASAAKLVAQLLAGEHIALISDAGTPLLSDPGARLVKSAIAAGIRVTPIPGASALLSALTIAGLPAESFTYVGFLPSKTGARRSMLTSLATLPTTLVFYEAPHRLCATLVAMQEVLGGREAAIARELTKRHEECIRGTLADLIAHFMATAPRGECVITVAGALPPAATDDAMLDAQLRALMADHSLKEAVTRATLLSGRSKRDVYARALALKDAP